MILLFNYNNNILNTEEGTAQLPAYFTNPFQLCRLWFIKKENRGIFFYKGKQRNHY